MSKPMDLQKVEGVSSTPALSCVGIKDLLQGSLAVPQQNLF